MTWLILAGSIAILGYIAARVTQRFSAAEGSTRDRLWAAVSGSATVATSYLGMVMMALPQAIVAMADLLDAPGVSEQIKALFPPEYEGIVGLGILVLVYLARLRTLP